MLNFMKSLGKGTLVILAIAFIAALFAWPLVIIWAANTLFPMLAIPYTFWTYLATCVFNISVFAGMKSKN